MKPYVYTPLKNNKYYQGILTILDYESTYDTCIEDLFKHITLEDNKSILFDTILKTGNNKFRFLKYKSQEDWSYMYNSPKKLELIANSILREHIEIVENSMISSRAKKEILERK